MNQAISQKFRSSENILFISGSIVDVMGDFKNIMKGATPYFSRVNLKEYTNLLQKMIGFSYLKSNWDSYNAEVISNIAIKSAKEVLDFLNNNGFLTGQNEVNIFPMRDGGIQFEFDGIYLCSELEVNPRGDLKFIQFDNEGNIMYEGQLYELSELTTLLKDVQYA